MKKHLYLIAAAVLAFVACAKEEAYQSTESTIPGAKRIVLGASFELPSNATKSDYDAAGNFSWSDDDAIWIGTDITAGTDNWGKGLIMEAEAEVGPGFKKAKFDCSIPGESAVTAVAAVFPTTVQPSYSDGTLSLKLPDTIAWTDTQLANPDPANAIMQVDNVMVARFADIYEGGYAQGTTNGLQFYNVGGLFCLTLKNVPAGAEKLIFTTDKKINGSFAVKNVVNPDDKKNYPQIETTSTETVSEKSITITFTTISNGENKMTFFIPVPVGSYVIGFDVQKADGTSVWKFSASKANGVERGHIVKMPTLSHVIVGGDGDGATNIITTPTSYSGTVYLPSTLNNIYVRMNQTDGTIKLEYSSAANAQHPQKVYLQALGDITELNINLPDSHVELTGEENVHTITKVSANTSYSTLKVDNKVKIGKGEDKNGITITGGSLDLGATVEGTVEVNIPDKNNNETEEKVAININSTIKKLEVTNASTKTAPDKIYVTLSSDSKVEETLSVPETNCNLYIAPNAQVKTVTTSAAENTVAGKVENLAATGEGTSVVVEKKGSITGSISSTDKASIVIVERTQKEVNEQTAGVITTNTSTKDQGTINTVADTAVAMIGGESYSTLAGAFAAVVDGQTIKLISDVTLEETFVVALGEKTVTLDLGGRTLTGRTNLTSGKLTLKNGNVVNTGGQPLNVYGSETPGAKNYSVLSVASDVTVTGKYGVCVFGNTASTNGYGAVVNVEGKLIANDGIFVSGNLGNYVADDMNNIVNISGTITSESDVAVALNGWATVNVKSGAKITGNTGIAVKRGVLNVYDGATVTANGQWVTPPAANNSGTEPTGAAVSMTNTYNNLGAMAVNIAGGSFTSANGEALYKANQTYSNNAATFTVTGGSFSSDPTAYLAPGYTTSGSNPWTVVKLEGAVTNLAELQDAITNNVTPIYYVGDAITEAFTLAPSAATTINGLKVNYKPANVTSSTVGLTINGDVTLNDANIVTNAYCGVSISEGNTVTFKNSTVDCSSAALKDSRAMNIWANTTVTIDGTTVKGSATAGSSRCLNILDEGAKVDVINGSTLSVSHYAINMPSTTVKAVVNVEDSSVNTGWAITNIWKTDNTINLTNCTLNSVNDKDYNKDGWNNFSAFVFNNDDTNISSGNVLTVNNCTVNVSSTTGNRQSLISMRGNNDTIKFIGSDGTIALAENGGISYEWSQLRSTLNNTLSFDKANYDQISESIDAACVVTNANNLYTISYVTEVYYYWFLDDVEDGVYCSLADPFESSSLILSNGEFIRLEKNIALTKNITVTLSDNLTAGNYFTMQFGDYTITKGNYSIILPAGLSVKTDKKTDVFTGANGAMIVETVSTNGEYTYTAVQSVAQIGSSYYATLADAVAAAGEGQDVTIKIIDDFTLEGNSGVTIPAGKIITLDLNGKTIKNLVTSDAWSHLIDNYGTLTITDSSAGANGTMTNEVANGVHTGSWSGYNYATNIITNRANATLTVIAGNLTQVATSNISYVIDNLGNNASTTIKGGNLTAGYIPIRSFNGTNLSVNIHGGTLSGLFDLYLQSSTILNIDGGTFSAPTRSAIYVEAASNITISGDAEFNNATDREFIAFDSDNAKDNSSLSVTGGTFNTDPSAYVANGYVATHNENVWVVEKAQANYWIDCAADSFASVDDNNKIIEIATAAQLAKLSKDIKEHDTNPNSYQYTGYTFKLTADIDLAGKIWTPIGGDLQNYYSASFRGTFDGDEHKISNMHAVGGVYSGLFGPIHTGMPVVIKNLKIDNFKVESNHYAGAIVAWMENATNEFTITGCTVSNGTITSSPELIGDKWDNGDKAGGLVGYLSNPSDKNAVSVTNNEVSNVDIIAYRDFGGLVGCATKKDNCNIYVTNNAISNVNLYQDNTHPYKAPEEITTYDALVGRGSSSITSEGNTVTDVTKYTGTPGHWTQK